MAINFLSGGLDEKQISTVMRASQDPEHPPPENGPLFEELSSGQPFTRRREDWIGTDTWQSAPHYELYRRPSGLDEFIYAIFPIGGGHLSGMGFHRKPGRPGFSEKDRLLAHIVMSEVKPLHAAGIAGPEDSNVLDMPPRVRMTFGLLLNGWKRRQIAQHLGISEHTARDYIRSVYRHYGVVDQVDLLKRFVVGDFGDRKK